MKETSVCPHCLGPIEICVKGCWYQKQGCPKMTPGQRRVFETITSFYIANGHSLSIRDIGAALSIRSTKGVSDHIKALLKKGYLQRNVKVARSWIPILPRSDTSQTAHILSKIVEEWEALAESFLEQEDPAQQAAGMMAQQMAQSISEQLEVYSASTKNKPAPTKHMSGTLKKEEKEPSS